MGVVHQVVLFEILLDDVFGLGVEELVDEQLCLNVEHVHLLALGCLERQPLLKPFNQENALFEMQYGEVHLLDDLLHFILRHLGWVLHVPLCFDELVKVCYAQVVLDDARNVLRPFGGMRKGLVVEINGSVDFFAF